jgi:hypothetical protein
MPQQKLPLLKQRHVDHATGDRAAQMQALALTMKDPEIVILMNDLADDHDRLADKAANGRKPPAQKGKPR